MASDSARRCVVIGAGVVGASVTAGLAQAGLRVTLLDQDRPGRATSRWSFAWLNSNRKAPRHYHDLNHAGMRAWADLAPVLDGAAWYRPVGHLELVSADVASTDMVSADVASTDMASADAGSTDVASTDAASTDAASIELATRVKRLADWGYPARLIDVAEANRLEPALLPGSAALAAWFGTEAYLLTEPLIDRLVARAAGHGAVLRTGEQGRVTGLEADLVRTAAGDVLAADDIVCCAGRWTPELAALAGAGCPVPLIPWQTAGATAPGLVVRVGPVSPPGPVRILHTPELSLRPHSGGLVQLEAEDAAVDLHTPPADLDRWAAELLRRARRTVRGLDDARVVDCQVCARPMPADGQSIVGRLPGAETVYVAVTHSGVTLAAHLSRLITSDLTGDLTGAEAAELVPYRPGRFAAEDR